MHYDRERVRENVRRADTEDLLDRATVYRSDMEPDALDLIDQELRTRGVSEADIEAHARRRQEAGLCDDGGMPARCSFCGRPAVTRGWGWHRYRGRWLPNVLRDRLPLFPRRFWYCAAHRPGAAATSR